MQRTPRGRADDGQHARRDGKLGARGARRLIPRLTVPVVPIFLDCPNPHRRAEGGIEPFGPFKPQDYRKGGVKVRPDTDRIGQLCKIDVEALGKGPGQRFQFDCP